MVLVIFWKERRGKMPRRSNEERRGRRVLYSRASSPRVISGMQHAARSTPQEGHITHALGKRFVDVGTIYRCTLTF
jgi:hypothetical protein